MGAERMRRGRASTNHGSGLYVVVSALALALVLLGAAGCGQRASGRAGAATTTATITPAPHLTFHAVTLPPGFTVPSGSLSVSPVDGRDAWACADAGKGSFQMWATADEGATWHTAGLLHPAAPMQPNGCGVLVDQHDTKAAVFEVRWGAGEAGNNASMSFYTRDGGQHWQQLPGWTNVSEVDTDGAHAYAIIEVITPPSAQQHAALVAGVAPPRLCAPCSGPVNQERWELVVSSDGLQTWRELHLGNMTSGDAVYQFWRRPTSDDMFAATYAGALLHSQDGGASWTQSSMPVGQISIGAWLASRKAWMFCGQQGQPPVGMCSVDTGNTWQQVPALTVTVHMQCDDWCHKKGGQDTNTLPCTQFAVTSEGSLLATCPGDNTGQAPVQFTAYRFAPGAAGWTMLGPVPHMECSVSADDIMWCLNDHEGGWETTSLPV